MIGAEKQLLLDMIKCALAQEKYSPKRLDTFLSSNGIPQRSEEYVALISNLYSFSEAQDLAHIPAEALGSSGAYGLFPETDEGKLKAIKAAFDKALMLCVVRFVRIDAELKRVSELLENEGIDFIPLKGSVIKTYYKNPKLRTSCDIDVFVKEEDLDRCDGLFRERLKYTRGNKNVHDVSYHSESGVHIELHYSLMESYNGSRSEKKLREVWDYSYKEEGYSHLTRLKGEFFYLYHIAHMAKHVVNGGCGIKPYMDMLVMKEAGFFDEDKASALLLECGLQTFASVQQTLCEVWFCGAEHTELTRASEDFIFSGGVYGNLDNYIAMHSAKRGSKLKYILSRIFPTHEELVDIYPNLRNKKWLTPIYHVRRWTHLIIKKGAAKRTISELKRTAAIDKSAANSAQDFMKALELI